MSKFRFVHVCTSHGVGMPAMRKAAAAEIFDRAAEAQLAKGRQRPTTTQVGRYVGRRAPALARTLHASLQAHAAAIAPRVARLYAARLQKDDRRRSVIEDLIAELNSEDLGLTLRGDLITAMQAAFKRAAELGATQVGLEVTPSITDQLDAAAVAYAAGRGGELIKDLAGTTDDDMRALLSRAVSEGMAPAELATSVRSLGAFGEVRAIMIARTELAFAHVQGNVAGWRESGQVIGKRSILGDLHDIADECDDAADAGVVGMDEDFGPGLSFPPYHPNCVCDVLPVLSDEDAAPGA